MDRKKGAFLATLGLVVLLVSLALSAPRTGLASPPPGDKDVRVVNTTSEPVPVAVQGTATVSGSVTVAGISSVNVTNSPSVTVTNTPSVSVANVAGNPVLVRNVDRGAGQPFSMPVVAVIPAGTTASSPIEFTVPAGKCLVIETVSLRVEATPGQEVLGAIAFRSGGIYTDFFIPLSVTTLTGISFHQATQPIKVYADASTPVWGYIRLNTNVSGTVVRFSVSGYLVDVP